MRNIRRALKASLFGQSNTLKEIAQGIKYTVVKRICRTNLQSFEWKVEMWWTVWSAWWERIMRIRIGLHDEV